MLPWRRFHLSYLITPRFSPACTGSGAVAALPVHDTRNTREMAVYIVCYVYIIRIRLLIEYVLYVLYIVIAGSYP